MHSELFQRVTQDLGGNSQLEMTPGNTRGRQSWGLKPQARLKRLSKNTAKDEAGRTLKVRRPGGSGGRGEN